MLLLVGLEFPHAEARQMCEAAKAEIAVDEDIGDAVKKALSYAIVPGVKSYPPSHEGSTRRDGVAEAIVPYGRVADLSIADAPPVRRLSAA